MTTTRRSIMWPLVIITVGSIWLLMSAGAFPEAVGDVLLRAWPALLILFGFDVLLGRRRLRILYWSVEMSLVGLVVMVLALAGLVWLAYAKQADVVRSDYVKTFSQTLPDEVIQMHFEISVGRTTVTIHPGSTRDLQAEFKGGKESEVQMGWSVEGDSAVFRVVEEHPNAIPRLANYGRGTLDITLPADVIIKEFKLSGERGDVTADLQPLRVEWLELAIKRGDLKVNLPAQDALSGVLTSGDGGIELLVPPGMALMVGLKPGSGDPNYQYDTLTYDVLRDGTLKR
jgi:hypothetical protein